MRASAASAARADSLPQPPLLVSSHRQAAASVMDGESDLSDLAAFLVGPKPGSSPAGSASPWSSLPPAVSPTVQALSRAFALQAAAAAAAAQLHATPPAPASAPACPAAPGRQPPSPQRAGGAPVGARLSRLRALYPSTPAPAQPAAAAAASAHAPLLPGAQPSSPASVLDTELAADLQAQARQVLARAAAAQQAQQQAGAPAAAALPSAIGRVPNTPKAAALDMGQGQRGGTGAAAEERRAAELRAAAAAAVAAAREPDARLQALGLVGEAWAGGAVLQVG